jgi:hypothetical protein
MDKGNIIILLVFIVMVLSLILIPAISYKNQAKSFCEQEGSQMTDYSRVYPSKIDIGVSCGNTRTDMFLCEIKKTHEINKYGVEKFNTKRQLTCRQIWQEEIINNLTITTRYVFPKTDFVF